MLDASLLTKLFDVSQGSYSVDGIKQAMSQVCDDALNDGSLTYDEAAGRFEGDRLVLGAAAKNAQLPLIAEIATPASLQPATTSAETYCRDRGIFAAIKAVLPMAPSGL